YDDPKDFLDGIRDNARCFFCRSLLFETSRRRSARLAYRASANGVRGRQGEAERSAVIVLAKGFDRTAVLLHDAVGDRKAQARAVTDTFRRKERIEYLGQILGRNALACIRNLNNDLIVAKNHCTKLDRAARLHRISGVEDKVREDLLKLS